MQRQHQQQPNLSPNSGVTGTGQPMWNGPQYQQMQAQQQQLRQTHPIFASSSGQTPINSMPPITYPSTHPVVYQHQMMPSPHIQHATNINQPIMTTPIQHHPFAQPLPTTPTVPLTLPECVDGGYRARTTLDVLPIDKLLPQIYQQVQQQPITIIQAATGSGKSSRIPATLVREWYSPRSKQFRDQQRQRMIDAVTRGRPEAEVNQFKATIQESLFPPVLRKDPFIIVTQPRRIAAISLAQRVSDELGEKIGASVGFKIGHETMADSKTKLLFVTSGWLLQKLVHQPSYLLEASHIILDEIHERGLDADILYVILKRILRALVLFDRQNNLNEFSTYPKLLLMSATFNTDLFGTYFSPIYSDIPKFRHFSNPKNLQPIQIDTRRYPVTIYHLEEILNCPILRENEEFLNTVLPDPHMDRIVSQLVEKMNRPPPPNGLGPLSAAVLHLLSWLIRALALVHRNDTAEGNCILIFLPGLQEIEAAAQLMDEDLLTQTYPKQVRTTINEQGETVEENVILDQSNDPTVQPTTMVRPTMESNYQEKKESNTKKKNWQKADKKAANATVDLEKEEDGTIETGNEPLASIVELMILHSMCEDQLKIFDPVAAGTTRVILSTNIAESSVTIPYVRYVLDLGSHKEVEFNARFQCEMLVKKFISQASAAQRAGRCGRLCPGTVFRIYPTGVFETHMDKYDCPELLRVSLASTILRLKMTANTDEEGESTKTKKSKKDAPSLGFAKFDPSVCNLNDPHAVLSECMQPPSLSSIDTAYEELIKNGAIELSSDEIGRSVSQEVSRFQNSVPQVDQFLRLKKQQERQQARGSPKDSDDDDSDDENDEFTKAGHPGFSSQEKRAIYQGSEMTPLGRFFAALPFSFHLSRLVALGVVFGPRYLVHSVVISSALSMSDIYFMPMQQRGATASGSKSHKNDDDDEDQFAKFVANTTRARMWADAGIGSDAIGIIRIIDAYLKYRQYLHEEYHDGGRRRVLLNTWCVKHGVHMKRIKSLASSISEICYRLSGIVHLESERDALLQLAAMCGKSKAHTVSTSRKGDAPATPAQEKKKKHYTYRTPGNAAADRDSDRGNSEHDDLYHLLSKLSISDSGSNSSSSASASASRAKYDHRADLLSTNIIPHDLLALDPECVAILQFMLTSALLPNLLVGTVAPKHLGQGIETPLAPGEYRSNEEDHHMDPANTYIISEVPAPLLQGRTNTLEQRPELAEIKDSVIEVLKALPDAPQKKRRNSDDSDEGISSGVGMMAFEFKNTPKYTRLRVGLDSNSVTQQLTLPDTALIPILTFPPLEMLILHRMFANGRLNIMDRTNHSASSTSQFTSSAYQSKQVQMYTVSNAVLPGKGIKWKLFSPHSKARIDFLSPMAQLNAFMTTVGSLKKEFGGLSDYDPMNEKKNDTIAHATHHDRRAAIKATTNKIEYHIFAVAANMTVSSGANAEIRAEKITLLPVGMNLGLTSIFLALLLPGRYIATEQSGLSGLSFEGSPVHFPFTLPFEYAPILDQLRLKVNRLLNQEFLTPQHNQTHMITPFFLKLIRPFMASTVTSYPTTEPHDGEKRSRPSQQQPSSSKRQLLVPSHILARVPENAKVSTTLKGNVKPISAQASAQLAAAHAKHEAERLALVESIRLKRQQKQSVVPTGEVKKDEPKKEEAKTPERPVSAKPIVTNTEVSQPQERLVVRRPKTAAATVAEKVSTTNQQSATVPLQSVIKVESSSSSSVAASPSSKLLAGVSPETDDQLIDRLKSVFFSHSNRVPLAQLGVFFTRHFPGILWRNLSKMSMTKFIKKHSDVFQEIAQDTFRIKTDQQDATTPSTIPTANSATANKLNQRN